jgi:hypothetical protein
MTRCRTCSPSHNIQSIVVQEMQGSGVLEMLPSLNLDGTKELDLLPSLNLDATNSLGLMDLLLDPTYEPGT